MARGGEYSGCPLGNEQMEIALKKLTERQQTAVTIMTKYSPSREHTIEMLFAPDTIEKAKAARDIIKPDTTYKTYELNGELQFMGNILINYEGSRVPPIRSERLDVQKPLAEPLITYIREVQKVYLQYEEVKAVLRWLNKNSTIGGIRYYWPSIMKVAPKDSVFAGMEKAPKRFDTPHDLSDWLAPMRRSAATVASMALMDENASHKAFDKNMSITCYRVPVFIKEKLPTSNEMKYYTDSVTFHM